MGMETLEHFKGEAMVSDSSPRILVAGAPHAGKRSIAEKLLAMGKTKSLSFSTSGVISHGWMIDTKYYTADVCISTARLMDGEANEDAKAYASSDHCQALILVFDLSNFSTFDVAREWAASLDLKKYEVLLCVGNKADRVPDHFGHMEYRKKLQKRGESSSDPHPEFWDFGIQQSEGSSLLDDEGESLNDLRILCTEWCLEHGFEYLETCAINHLFDQCISVDGDVQGIDRIYGALSAHMWPGLLLKEANKGPFVDVLAMHNDEGDSTDEDSEVSIDYERLSRGSAEPWDSDEGPWTFYESAPLPGGQEEISTSAGEEPLGSSLQGSDLGSTNGATTSGNPGSTNEATSGSGPDTRSACEPVNSPSLLSLSDMPISNGQVGDAQMHSLREEVEHVHQNGGRGGDTESTDFEHLMLEVSRMRENGRVMPDAQRREMAASLAMRMAAIFDDDDF